MNFKEDWRVFTVNMVSKLFERCLLASVKVQNARLFIAVISNSEKKNEKLLKGIMHHLIYLKFLTHSLADKAAMKVSQFAEN